MSDKLRILIVGAHPDDPDYSAGGTAALYARHGHQVKLVSLTNGDAGHHEQGGLATQYIPLVRDISRQKDK